MKSNGILDKFVKLFSAMKFESLAYVGREPDRIGRLDAAILKVAMLVAALDGNLTDDEISAFGKLARKCRGATPESVEEVLDEGLRAAGYILIQARRLGERALIAKFAEEVRKAMPDGFSYGDERDVRRALVMWISMAMSDSDFSGIERKCLEIVRREIADAMHEHDEADAKTWREVSPAFAVAYVSEGKALPGRMAPDGVFMDRAEVLLAKLRRESSAAEAARQLKELVVNGK